MEVISWSSGTIGAAILAHMYIAVKDPSLPLLAYYPFLPLQKQCILCGYAKIYVWHKLLSLVKIKIKLWVAIEHEGNAGRSWKL